MEIYIFQGDPEAFPGHLRDIISPACPESSQGPPTRTEGRARNTSPGKCPGGILTRCPSHLIWLFSMWRSNKYNTIQYNTAMGGCVCCFLFPPSQDPDHPHVLHLLPVSPAPPPGIYTSLSFLSMPD